jgi:hypothetical protein
MALQHWGLFAWNEVSDVKNALRELKNLRRDAVGALL